jgi:hypothetical protein
MSSWPKEAKPEASDCNLANSDCMRDADQLSPVPLDQLIPYLRDHADRDEFAPIATAAPVVNRTECLLQLLAAFSDIADRDDIHQAAERLVLIQEWIKREAVLAAHDPIFAPHRLAF